MRVLAIFYLLITAAQAMPINFSFPNSKGHASICRYCLCDRHTATVSCNGGHLHIRVVSLPSWAETFQAHNITLTDLPHFTYHSTLRVLRINFCQLRYVHPLALVPLPNLETVHLANNLLETIPEAFLQRATRLKILNLARNQIGDLRELEWSLPEGLILEQLVLDGNPILFGTTSNHPYPWPLAKQLHMADTGVKSLSSTGMVFEHRAEKTRHYITPNNSNSTEERSLFLSDNVWRVMELLDLSNNDRMQVESSALQKLSNLTTLKAAQAMLQPEILQWIESPNTKCRHLDLRDANITFPSQSRSSMAHFGGYHGSISTRQWTFCSPNLEWLDISGTGIDALYIPSYCRIKWLFASRNQLESVRVQSGTLKTFELDHNRLTDWPLAGGNQIIPGDFGAPFSPFKQLESVSLANNSLESLPEDWLSWLPALQHLDLSYNKLLSLFYSRDGPFALGNSQLRYLNLSSNSLRTFPGLTAPDMDSLIVLDLSANSLHSIGADLFAKMPQLEHLHLNDNPNLRSSMANDDQKWLTNAAGVSLRELDMSNCGLFQVPDVSRLQRLSFLRLNSNYLNTLNDANQLPECVAHIEVRDNRIQTLGNMSRAQIDCLKEFDVGLNPLICHCSLVQFAIILQQQPSIEDRSEYYCFADDWQHSLKAYLEGSADFCEITASKSNGGLRYITTLLVNMLGIVSLLVGGAALIAFVVFKLSNLVGYRFIPFAYKPVPQTEAPVSL
ncbi:leucine rich repeat domain-containing protein [Ditylenchus destructor]|uniref:Leucine rich repeat domain-containing protein n=1 Tax=Ditylenchus destructor TaxID=166010 RepID=A0AAD4N9P8_9BILA|nr:leucine rich repeat domain-containing protein [Ditylenchus destructor]